MPIPKKMTVVLSCSKANCARKEKKAAQMLEEFPMVAKTNQMLKKRNLSRKLNEAHAEIAVSCANCEFGVVVVSPDCEGEREKALVRGWGGSGVLLVPPLIEPLVLASKG